MDDGDEKWKLERYDEEAEHKKSEESADHGVDLRRNPAATLGDGLNLGQ